MIRKNSIVSGDFNPHKLDMLEMTDQMADKVIRRYPNLRNAVVRRQVYARFSTLNQMLDVNGYHEERKAIIRFIKQYKKAILMIKEVLKGIRLRFDC